MLADRAGRVGWLYSDRPDTGLMAAATAAALVTSTTSSTTTTATTPAAASASALHVRIADDEAAAHQPLDVVDP